jgi:hypothetical protein
MSISTTKELSGKPLNKVSAIFNNFAVQCTTHFQIS